MKMFSGLLDEAHSSRPRVTSDSSTRTCSHKPSSLTPGIAIVLSTSWVRHYRFTKAAKFLPPELRRRVVGATSHTDMHEHSFATKPRGLQIWEDVQRRQPKALLALDDDDELWPEALRANLKTHPELGISEPNVMAEFRVKLALLHSCNSTLSPRRKR